MKSFLASIFFEVISLRRRRCKERERNISHIDAHAKKLRRHFRGEQSTIAPTKTFPYLPNPCLSSPSGRDEDLQCRIIFNVYLLLPICNQRKAMRKSVFLPPRTITYSSLIYIAQVQ